MKRITKVLSLLLLVALAVSLPIFSNSRTYRNASLEEDILNEIELIYNQKSLPLEINNAVKTGESTLISKVKKSASMGITIPNINMSKIIAVYPLTEYGDEENNVFIQDLKQHGYSMDDIYNLNYEDYHIISSQWLMDEQHIRSARNLYPELKDIDLTTWTIGDFEAYFRKVDSENYKISFTDRQMQELNKRNISLEDAYLLIKEYQHIDNALSQPDAVLKSMIEQHYQFKLDQLAIMAEIQNSLTTRQSLIEIAYMKIMKMLN